MKSMNELTEAELVDTVGGSGPEDVEALMQALTAPRNPYCAPFAAADRCYLI